MQISTYSYSFPNLEEGYSTYLVPVLDLLNHAASHAANVMIHMEEDNFVAKALKDINEGEEVSLGKFIKSLKSLAMARA